MAFQMYEVEIEWLRARDVCDSDDSRVQMTENNLKSECEILDEKNRDVVCGFENFSSGTAFTLPSSQSRPK